MSANMIVTAGADGSPSSGSGAAPTYALSRRGFASQGPFHSSANLVSVAAGSTVINQFHIPYTVRGMRIVLQNFSTSAITYDGVAIKAVATHKNQGGTGTKVQVKFSGANSVTVPAATGSGVDIIPGYAVSDPFTLAGIARTDGGTGYLYNLRAYTAGGGSVQSMPDTFAAVETASGLQYAGGVWAAFDGVTQFFDQAINGTTAPVLGYVQFASDTPIVTIAGYGDSIVSANGCGWKDRAAKALRDRGYRVVVVNHAQGGSGYATARAIAAAYLPIDNANIALLPQFSVNDITGTADPLFAFSRMLEAAEAARSSPMTWTAIPTTLYASRNVAIRAANALVPGLGIPYAGFYAAIVNPANQDQILPAYDADGIHPNVAGHTAMATVFVDAVLASKLIA